MTSLVFQHPEHAWITAVLVAAFALGVGWSYRRSTLTGKGRWLAPVCKLLAWSLLAALLTDPVWLRRQPKIGENEIAIVADNSASLGIAEAMGRPARAVEMKKALVNGADDPSWMNEISRVFRIKKHVSDDRLHGVADFSELDFQGQRSELNRALNTLGQGSSGSRLAAVVLVTDGQPTDDTPSAPAFSVPVFPVLVGDQSPAPDLILTECSVAQTPFEDTPVIITAHVAGVGFDDQEIAVLALNEAGKVVVTEKVKRLSAGKVQTVRLQVPTAKPGVSFYRIVVMAAELTAKLENEAWRQQAGEVVLENNERLVCVDRGQGPYRILYLAGRPNWEYKFLRRALAGDSEMHLPSLIRIAKREPKFEWRGRSGESSNPLFRGFGQQEQAQRYDQPVLIRLGTRDAEELRDGFPKTAEALLGGYRAVIIDDLEAEFFTQEQHRLLERFVSERGGALLMLGGQECYQAGGYEHSPIGRMLPVYLDRSTTAVTPVTDGRFMLTREGWLEPWTRLRPTREAEEQRMASMTGFYAVNALASIKPGASVLATIERGEPHPALPALVAHRFGEGRVAALAIGDFWRWGLSDEESGKDLQRSWRQLLRWLVVDVPDRVEIHAMSDAERVRLAVRVRDRAFQPLDDAVVKIEVSEPDGRSSSLFAEPSTREAGLFETEFFPRIPGAYRAVAKVEAGENEIENRATGWVHDPKAEEFARLASGQAWAREIAQVSGGAVLSLTDLASLPDRLRDLRAPIEETLIQPLWHTPWFFALVLGLLGTEWWLRRKGGLA